MILFQSRRKYHHTDFCPQNPPSSLLNMLTLRSRRPFLIHELADSRHETLGAGHCDVVYYVPDLYRNRSNSPPTLCDIGIYCYLSCRSCFVASPWLGGRWLLIMGPFESHLGKWQRNRNFYHVFSRSLMAPLALAVLQHDETK